MNLKLELGADDRKKWETDILISKPNKIRLHHYIGVKLGPLTIGRARWIEGCG